MFRIIKRIINWTGEYKHRLYKGFVCSFFNTMFTAFPIMAAAYTFNLIVTDTNNKSNISSSTILLVFVALAVATLLRFYTAYKKACLQESIAYEMTAKERNEIGSILKRVPLGFFQKNNAGDLTSAVTTDLSYMELYGMKMIDTVVNGYISSFTMVLCLAFFSWQLALVAVAGILLSGFALSLLGKKSRNNAAQHLTASEKMTGSTLEYILGLPVIKAFGQQGIAIKNIAEAYQCSKKINIKIEKQFVPCNCLHQFFLKVASVLIVLGSSYFALQGTMSLATMVMMLIFSFTLFSNVEIINNAIHVLEIINKNMDKIDSIKQAEFIDKDGKDIKLNNYDIEFNNVTFSYDKREILKNMSFRIPQNTTTAIIGASGSGKTTICKLIAKFYNPNSGNITIGGTDIKKLTCDSLLKNISMVFQNVYLFKDTVLNNIKFGNPNVDFKDVVKAAKAARCHEFIMQLPKGYNTVIGEGGSSLSGGEKQRISIARAILKDSPIVILDEATASVDPENEHHIQVAVNNLTHGKTIIIIAHRLATIKHANQILAIENGKISQKGSHESLKNEQGIYRKFLNIREKAEGWSI